MRQSPEETRTTSLSFALFRKPRYYLRASDRSRRRRPGRHPGGRGKRQSVVSGRPNHLTSFAFHPSAGLRKSPSNRPGHRHGGAYHQPTRSSPAAAVPGERACTGVARGVGVAWAEVGSSFRAGCVRSGRVVPTRGEVDEAVSNQLRDAAGGSTKRVFAAATQASSMWSMPCLDTFAFVIPPGIQSGLSLGASSCHAHAS